MPSASNHHSRDLPNTPIAPTCRGRFALVLFAALVLSAGQPLIETVLSKQITYTLGAAAFATLGAAQLAKGNASEGLSVASHVLAAALFALALWDIVRTILVGHSSGDAILATVCGYLILGIVWGLLYESLETAYPGSFRLTSAGPNEEIAGEVSRSDLGYFSFVTLSTVGYGDIVPTSQFARTLVWMEAVAGQFYLAILVAGLVGFRIAQSTKSFE